MTTPLWTFGAPSSPRRGGVFSGAVGMKEMGVLELMLLVFWGWRRAGGFGGPYWECGPTVADLALLLADGGRSCWIWRSRSSLGMFPDPHATAICGLFCSFWWFIKP